MTETSLTQSQANRQYILHNYVSHIEAGGTLNEIGTTLGITRERVRQIVKELGLPSSPKIPRRDPILDCARWRHGEFWVRFWSKVQVVPNKDACWLWTAGVEPTGYGRFGLGKEGSRQAHRVAMLYRLGRWPKGHVCHTCNVRACCNPSHLYEGTQADNVRDRQSRFGCEKWVGVCSRRYSLSERAKMRHLRAKGMPYHKIAVHLGATINAVRRWAK